jgi:hypothetical protein
VTDDLKLLYPVLKFVDERTLSEIIKSLSSPNKIGLLAAMLQQWSSDNFMIVAN